jgi:hypothetical protein
MYPRQRFLATLSGQPVDRPPLFKEGIRDEVLESWYEQGLPADKALEDLFVYDEFDEFVPDLYPQPELKNWPKTKRGLGELRKRLDADDPRRLPKDWAKQTKRLRERDYPLMLRLHNGFFLSMGVEEAQRFNEAVLLLKDDPGYVHEVLRIQTEFACRMAERVLQEVPMGAVIIGEPIASSHGPLISPKMYEEFMLSSYEPLLDLAEQHKIPVVIFRSYANFRALLPVVLNKRFNCLWACECGDDSMDYRRIRDEYGLELGLIGGVDGDVLRSTPADIQREVEEKVVPLLEMGRYIPLADGRVRDDVPFENYAFYRRLLEKVVGNR